MSEFLAEAQVVVRANTKLFVADFQKAVKKVEATKVTVTVRASMAGFRNDLVAKLKGSEKGLTVKVRVRPDFTGFREAVQAGATNAARGVTIPVGARAGAVTAGAATAAGGVVDRRAATAQLAVNAAIDAGVAARRRLTGELSDEEKFAARLAREELHLKASMDAVNKAAISGVPALLERAQAEERDARAALAASRAQQERRTLGVPIGVSTEDFKAQIAAQAALNASRQRAEKIEVAHATALIENQRRIQAAGKLESAAIRENEKRDQAAADAAAAATTKRLSGIQAEVKALQSRAAAAKAAFAASPRGVSAAAATKGITESEADIARARRISASAALIEVDAQRKLTTANNVLRINTDALVVAEEAYQAALASGSAATIQAAALNLKLAESEQVAAAAAAAQANAEAFKSNIFTTGRRALVAQIANLTGLRGAALTAASGFIAVSAAFIALRKSVGIAAQLQTELAVFQVTAGATAEDMERVRETAVRLGKDLTLPGVSASDAAVALTELSKAGLGVEDSIGGARGVLQLATAANIDFTQATQLSASALNAFGLAGEDASHVADVLANSANESQGSITDAGVALQQSAAVARQAGLSLEQTVAALTLFARAGLRGSDAGTSLRTALIRLINPSAKAAELIQKLGLRIRTSTGAIDLGVFQQFTDATRKLTTAQRDQALAIIFGQDAIRGAAILAREGASGLGREQAAIEKAGTAAEVASARTSGYQGSIENLKNELEGLGEEIGANLLGPLSDSVDILGSSLRGVESLLGGIEDLRKAAVNPIEVLIKGKIPETGDTEKGSLEKLFAKAKEFEGPLGPIKQGINFEKVLFFGNVFSQLGSLVGSIHKLGADIQDSRESLEDLTNINFSKITTIAQARAEVKKFVDEVNKSKGSSFVSNDAIVNLRKLQENLSGGDAEAQLFAKDLGPLIDRLTKLSTGKFKPVEIPVTLKKGDTDKVKKEVVDQVADARDEIAKFVGALNFALIQGQDTSKMVNGLKKVRKELQGGTADERALGDRLGEFLKTLGAKVEQGKPIRIPLTLRDPGDVAKLLADAGWTQAGESAEKAFMASFRSQFLVDAGVIAVEGGINFGNLFSDALKGNVNFDGLATAAKRAAGAAASAFKIATTQGENQATGFDRRVLDAQLARDTNAEIAARKAAIKSRQREIARIEKAFDVSGPPIPGGRPQLTGSALKAVTAAKKDIKAQQDAVDSLVKQQEQDTKQKVADIKEKRDKADQALLDALGVGRTPFERRIALAQQTPGLSDNVSALKAFRKRLQAEVVAVRNGVKDAGTKAKELQRLSDELFQNSLDIKQARKDRNDAIVQAATDRGVAIQSIGETSGSFKLLLLGIDIQITAAKQAIERAKKGTVAWLQAKVNLGALKKARQDAINEARTNVLDAAFNLAEARGNKSLMLAIIDRQIAEAKKEQAQAKNLLDRLTAMGKVAELIQKKRDILQKDLQQDQGPTVFDLLAQARETFNANAGTLIDVNQTIAGATGFTADIAGMFKRVKPIGVGTGAPFGKPSDLTSVSASADKQVSSNNNLIAAIDRWIRVVENQASGNSSTLPHGAGGLGGAAVPGRRWFVEAGWARNAQDS